jgi:hypothetical protein
VKLWKIAISLAAAGALGAPLIVGTWKDMPRKWVPFTEERRQEIAKAMNSCKDEEADRLHIFLCQYSKSKLLGEGGEYVKQPDPFKYWTINLAVALPVFVGIFGLAMVIPPIALRYWRWPRT